jgi:hypothetical protein
MAFRRAARVHHVESQVEEDIVAAKVGAATRQHSAATTAAASLINLRHRWPGEPPRGTAVADLQQRRSNRHGGMRNQGDKGVNQRARD